MHKKGIIEAIPGYFYILIALLIGGIMIMFLLQFLGEKSFIISQIPKNIAKLAHDCWKLNRYGMNTESSVCFVMNISDITNESEITKYLKCEELPNNLCYPDNCSFCTSKYAINNDSLEAFIENSGYIKIAYVDKRIVISSLECDNSCECKRDCIREANRNLKEGKIINEVDEEYNDCILSCEA